MSGIEQLKDVVVEGAALGNAIVGAMEDGKINIADLPRLLDPVSKLPAALAGISEVPAELADLDEAEKADLFALIQSKLELKDEHVEEVVVASLNLGSALHDLITVLRKNKAAPVAE